jgi:hypothetical protein
VKRRRASKDSSRAAPAAVEGRAFALLLVLFWGSGCAALIYEVVWLQMLELVLGSSAVSIGGGATGHPTWSAVAIWTEGGNDFADNARTVSSGPPVLPRGSSFALPAQTWMRVALVV